MTRYESKKNEDNRNLAPFGGIISYRSLRPEASGRNGKLSAVAGASGNSQRRRGAVHQSRTWLKTQLQYALRCRDDERKLGRLPPLRGGHEQRKRRKLGLRPEDSAGQPDRCQTRIRSGSQHGGLFEEFLRQRSSDSQCGPKRRGGDDGADLLLHKYDPADTERIQRRDMVKAGGRCKGNGASGGHALCGDRGLLPHPWRQRGDNQHHQPQRRPQPSRA